MLFEKFTIGASLSLDILNDNATTVNKQKQGFAGQFRMLILSKEAVPSGGEFTTLPFLNNLPQGTYVVIHLFLFAFHHPCNLREAEMRLEKRCWTWM